MLRRASLSNQAEFICFTHLPAHLILSAVTTVTAPGLILWPIHALSRQSVGRAEEGGCRSVCVCMCVGVCVCVCVCVCACVYACVCEQSHLPNGPGEEKRDLAPGKSTHSVCEPEHTSKDATH